MLFRSSSEFFGQDCWAFAIAAGPGTDAPPPEATDVQRLPLSLPVGVEAIGPARAEPCSPAVQAAGVEGLRSDALPGGVAGSPPAGRTGELAPQPVFPPSKASLQAPLGASCCSGDPARHPVQPRIQALTSRQVPAHSLPCSRPPFRGSGCAQQKIGRAHV